ARGKQEKRAQELGSDMFGVCSQGRDHNDFLARMICGPPITVSISAVGEIHIADTLGICLIRTFPLVGPSTSKLLDSPSAIVPLFAMPLTANSVFKGFPVSGSTIWPVEVPSREGAVCSDVETLWSLSMTCGSMMREGSLRCNSQAD